MELVLAERIKRITNMDIFSFLILYVLLFLLFTRLLSVRVARRQGTGGLPGPVGRGLCSLQQKVRDTILFFIRYFSIIEGYRFSFVKGCLFSYGKGFLFSFVKGACLLEKGRQVLES